MSKRTQVILARREAEAASVMLDDLRKLRWLWLDPGRLSDEHPLLAAFAETSVVAKAEERSEFRLPLIAATSGWDQYLATRKKSFRKQRKRGHLGSPLTVRTYPEDFNSVESLLTAIDFVARRSWAFDEQTSVVSVEDEWSFWQCVIRDADARGLLHASCVFDGENPAAFIFGMLDHGVLYALKTAFVVSEANLGPGRLAISSFVQEAMSDEAIEMVDLDCVTSRGDYKLSWATEVQTVRSYYAFRQGFCPGLLKTAYRLKKNWSAERRQYFADHGAGMTLEAAWHRGAEPLVSLESSYRELVSVASHMTVFNEWAWIRAAAMYGVTEGRESER